MPQKKTNPKSRKAPPSKKKIGHHVVILDQEFQEETTEQKELSRKDRIKIAILNGLTEWLSIMDLLNHYWVSQANYQLWKKWDPNWAQQVSALAIENKSKIKQGKHDLVKLYREILPFLQMDCTEKEAAESVGLTHDAWKQLKAGTKVKAAAWDTVSIWFLEWIEVAKSGMFTAAKEALKNWFKESPKVALSFLQSRDSGRYKSWRHEFTWKDGAQLMHYFPATPEGYEQMLKKAAAQSQIADDES